MSTVKVSATDDKQVSMVELSIDSGSWIDVTDNFDGTYYNYDWDTTTVADGWHTLDAIAMDSSSQTTGASQVRVGVDNIPGDTTHAESIDFKKTGKTLHINVEIYDDVLWDRFRQRARAREHLRGSRNLTAK